MDDQTTPTGNEGPGSEGAVPPLRDSVSSAGERIQVIIEAAEKAAAGIIEDADAQAHHYIEASRERADVLADERVRVMSDLTDTLIRQAEMVKRQSDDLLAALDSARSELAGRIGQELSSGSPGAPAQPPQGFGQAGEASRVSHLQPVESARPGLQAVAPPVQPQTAPQPVPQPPPAPAQHPNVAPPPPPQQPMSQPPAGDAPASDGARLLAAQMAVAGSSRKEIEVRLRDEFGIQDATPILDGILGPG